MLDGIVERKGIPQVYTPRSCGYCSYHVRSLEGRGQDVAGWRDFARMAHVLEWHETGHRVQLYCSGTCAVVTYLFTIRFETGGIVQEMRGRDMLFLVNGQGRWQVVADQFSPEPPV